MINEETIYEVVKKLVGPITPVGCTRRDSDRLGNMSIMCQLINMLTEDVLEIADDNRESQQGSMKMIAKCADNNLARVPQLK